MHSSPFVHSSLLDAIKIGEEFANEYLESSLKKVDHFFKQTTQFELNSNARSSEALGKYGIAETLVFCSED